MSIGAESPGAPGLGGSSLSAAKPLTWGSKLEQAWPLFFAGFGCVTLAVVLAVQRTGGSLGDFSPVVLFVVLGIIGIAGGVASFVVGPEDHLESNAATDAVSRLEGWARSQLGEIAENSVSRKYGRPAPLVIVPEWSESSEYPGSIPPWTEGSESPAAAAQGAQTEPPQATWEKGRLLHLSADGALTVYSLDDAIRDLELVSKVVHGEPVPPPEKAKDAQPPPTD